jgi:hypothetical protein
MITDEGTSSDRCGQVEAFRSGGFLVLGDLWPAALAERAAAEVMILTY